MNACECSRFSQIQTGCAQFVENTQTQPILLYINEICIERLLWKCLRMGIKAKKWATWNYWYTMQTDETIFGGMLLFPSKSVDVMHQLKHFQRKHPLRKLIRFQRNSIIIHTHSNVVGSCFFFCLFICTLYEEYRIYLFHVSVFVLHYLCFFDRKNCIVC